MTDVAKGQLYVGEQIAAATHERSGTTVMLAASDFTTHGVIVGMTGSGKTGLGLVLVEEALLSGVPVLIIDPKGDLTNLALTFPDLAPADFRPWINEGDATRAGTTPDAFAEQEATKWREGLASWGVDPARIAALRAAADITIYTPGSTSGVPLNLVGSLQAPKNADAETIADEVEGFVSGLLGLVDIEADPLSSREHILLSNIVAASWTAGSDLDLATLVGQVQHPPVRKLGVFEVDTFFPPKDRTELALTLNGLLASPSFAAWTQGVPFDIDRLLTSPEGKPAAAIVTIADLSDPERQFVTSLLLGKLVTWMRRQSGTTDLRALMYMDEVAGYAPPTAEPPSKKPLLTLLKQARAFGVGLVLSTQNPVDLDYKAISNAGTWMIGRLQTERDKARLLDGMAAASGDIDVAAVGDTIGGLGKREFVLKRAGVDKPIVFTTRWAMAYLRGPLTREQIASLTKPSAPAAPLPPPAPGTAMPAPATTSAPADASPVAPRVADSVPVRWLDPAAPWAAQVGAIPGGTQLVAAAIARVSMTFDDDKAALRETTEWETVLCPLPPGPDPTAAVGVDYDERDLTTTKPTGAEYVLPEAPIATKTYWTSLQRNLVDQLVRTRTMDVARNAKLKLYGRPGETAEAFTLRCTEAADAVLADTKLAALRDKYEPRFRKAREALAAAEDKVEVHQAQADATRNDSIFDAATSILGDFLGGKRNARSMGRSISRGTGRTQTANERLESAANRAAAEQDVLGDLEEDFVADLEAVKAEAATAAAEVEIIQVPLEKTDVKVVDLGLVWDTAGPMLSLLRRNRDFRTLFTAQVISYMGDWFATVAVLGLVLDLTDDSGFAAAMVFVAQSLPAFFVTPLAGTVADRFDRRKVLVIASSIQSVAALGFLLVGPGRVWMAYVAQGTIAVLGAFFAPASNAALPNLVDKKDLPLATALMSSTWGAMLAIGAALGAVFTVVFGRDAAFIADAVSFAVAGTLIFTVRRRMREEGSEPDLTKRMRPLLDTWEALRYAWHRPQVLALLGSKAGFGLGTGVVGLLAVLAAETFDVGDGGTGLLLTMRGLGVVAGPLLANRVAKRGVHGLLLACGVSSIVYGVAYGFVPFAPGIAVAAVLVLIVHLGGGCQWTFSTYGLQVVTPDALRGRIFAVDFAMVTMTMSLSLALAGWMSSVVGVGPTIVGVACIQIAWGILYLVLTKALRAPDESLIAPATVAQ